MRRISIALLSLTLLFLIAGCGAGDSLRATQSGTPELIGEVLLGTQCSFGTLPDPIPGLFALRDCRMERNEIELLTPPGPIYIYGDCAEKTVGIRTLDGAVDTLWQALPDGSFSLTIPGFSGRWSADLDAEGACSSAMTLDVSGRLLCENRDIFTIKLETLRLWMSPEERLFSERHCRMPASCRLETSRLLRQCG